MKNLAEIGRSMRAFSLIELLVTVALLGILLALAVPSFSGLMARTRMQSAASAIAVALATARSEAVKRGRDVLVCPSSDGSNCSGGPGWDAGWVIFAVAGTPIKAFDAPSGRLSIVAAGLEGGAVTFASTGATNVGAGARITVCRPGETARVVSVAVSGRTRVAEGGVCS